MRAIIEGVVAEAKVQKDFETKAVVGSTIEVNEASKFEPVVIYDCPVGLEERVKPGEHFMAVVDISTRKTEKVLYVRFAGFYDPEQGKRAMQMYDLFHGVKGAK